jgi:hypothetical protein
VPIIQPDTSAAQEMSAIEPGTYPAKVVSVDFKMSSKNNPMIVPKFEVTVDGKKRNRQSYLVITGEGAMGFDQLLRACKFDQYADQYRDPNQPNPDFDTDLLVGQELMVTIGNEIYNGEKRDNIKGYLKA